MTDIVMIGHGPLGMLYTSNDHGIIERCRSFFSRPFRRAWINLRLSMNKKGCMILNYQIHHLPTLQAGSNPLTTRPNLADHVNRLQLSTLPYRNRTATSTYKILPPKSPAWTMLKPLRKRLKANNRIKVRLALVQSGRRVGNIGV
jgi:hypothetical protein